MAEHLSEEQQLETLKRWWQENGLQLVLVIVITLAGWFVWQKWQENKQVLVENASLIYIEMMDVAAQSPLSALSGEQREALIEKAQLLKNDYDNSQYSHYASLLLAKLAVAEKRLDDAAKELQIVIDNTRGEELSYIARLRLARVEMGRKNYSQALRVLEGETPPTILSSVAELRGDIHLLSGDNVAARAAYQSALNVVGDSDQRYRALLELKLNQVLSGAISTNDSSAEDAS